MPIFLEPKQLPNSNVISISGGATLGLEPSVVLMSGTSNYVVNLPSTSGFARRSHLLKLIADGITVRINPPGGSTIDGNSFIELTARGSAIEILSDGNNWQVISAMNLNGDSSIRATGNITTNNLVQSGAGTAGSVVSLNVSGYSTAVITISGTYGGPNSLLLQGTIDGTAWQTICPIVPPGRTTSGLSYDVSVFEQVRVSAPISGHTGTATIQVLGSKLPLAKVRTSNSRRFGIGGTFLLPAATGVLGYIPGLNAGTIVRPVKFTCRYVSVDTNQKIVGISSQKCSTLPTSGGTIQSLARGGLESGSYTPQCTPVFWGGATSSTGVVIAEIDQSVTNAARSALTAGSSTVTAVDINYSDVDLLGANECLQFTLVGPTALNDRIYLSLLWDEEGS